MSEALQELATHIAANAHHKAAEELVYNLSNKKKDIQHDCIKVLYEVGEIAPTMIASYAGQFLSLLQSKNNRLQWGGMTALHCLVHENPVFIYKSLPTIMEAAEKGSVITRDNAVNILIKLAEIDQYAETAYALIMEQLLSSPVNQLPMYAERVFPLTSNLDKAPFIQVLTERLNDLEKDSQRKRVQKVLKKVSKDKS